MSKLLFSVNTLPPVSVNTVNLLPNIIRLDIAVIGLNMLKVVRKLDDNVNTPIYWGELKQWHDDYIRDGNTDGDVLYETHRHKKTGWPTRDEYDSDISQRMYRRRSEVKKGRRARISQDKRVIKFRLPTHKGCQEPS